MPKMPKVAQGKFKILSNKKVGPDYYRMAISAPRIAKQASPGQFVHLRCQESLQPLLRRPFSFHRLNGSSFEILYKIVGQGTNLLAKRRKGDKIDILGPLGKGFVIAHSSKLIAQRENIILVAGGIGVAPLLALAEKLAYSVERIADRKNIIALIGAKTKKEILCAKEFKKLGAKVHLATDDGSLGYKGFVTHLLKKVLLSTVNYELSTIYACGPKPMLKEIARIGKRLPILAYGSLEENMACGLGACLGCAIQTKEGYKRVCKDGPIFNLQEIQW
ncbi:MAG: dihydroorotate dehydrogenase electron transfer subunit [Candidatus Omnitrophica bacterium]|nr:dihydroorotate dehydrogenase electron transfer subunit [Candidatus Omnitrophota bacterium]